MKTIDLHVHSNISDGSLTPAQVTELAYNAGLSAYALTDHDCTDGYKEALMAAEKLSNSSSGRPFEVIPAVEISAGYNDRDIHILGFYIDPDNEELNSALALTRERRFKRNITMIKRFNDSGIDISYDELTFGNPNTIITRGHFSRLLIEKGYAKNREESFSRYLNPDTKFFVPREYIDIKETVRLIRQAGGIPFLAHPLLYKLTPEQVEKLVSDFKANDGAGLEAIYSSNSPEEEIFVKSLADKYDLMICGGTDFHGASKPDLEIGVGKGNMTIPYEILEQIKKYKGETQ
ncbi:MAG: PHP domain-containing protein [Lachnospiraceae bacterium]|nr:PHP domain-containing protein [Lachnospiraceae bacterium]